MSVSKTSCGHTLSVLLDKFLSVEWLGLRVDFGLTFKETAKLSFRVVVAFYVATSSV